MPSRPDQNRRHDAERLDLRPRQDGPVSSIEARLRVTLDESERLIADQQTQLVALREAVRTLRRTVLELSEELGHRDHAATTEAVEAHRIAVRAAVEKELAAAYAVIDRELAARHYFEVESAGAHRELAAADAELTDTRERLASLSASRWLAIGARLRRVRRLTTRRR
jgi:hypothetical protein